MSYLIKMKCNLKLNKECRFHNNLIIKLNVYHENNENLSIIHVYENSTNLL
jgi:hypothetical protein